MRAELYRGLCLLLILTMLLAIQPAAFAEELSEDVILEESVALPAPEAEQEVTEDGLLYADEAPEPEPEEEEYELELELWPGETMAYTAPAEENTDETVRFESCSLVFSDRIGLAFYLDIPERCREGGYMIFDSAGERRCVIPPAAEPNGSYRFVCWLSPVEMASDITPVYCRAELSVPGPVCSVKAFIEAAKGTAEYKLLCALGDWGHFAELCFGEAEPAMPLYRAGGYNHDAIRKALAAHEITWTPMGNVESVKPVLSLDPNFSLLLSVGMKDEEAKPPALSVYDMEPETAGTSDFRLAYVKLNGFGTALDVNIASGGRSADLRVSALSAIWEALDPAGSFTPEQRDFYAALYTLYEAASAYRTVT